MIRVNIMEPELNRAYHNAHDALPVIPLERAGQYFCRWEDTYSCRIRGDYVEFPNEEIYTWFVAKWA